MKSTFRLVNFVVAGLFVISAALQYNDPDPWRWAALYLAAAAACLIRGSLWPALLVLVVSAVWAFSMAPTVLPELELRNLAKEMHASTPAIEESREMLGLAIIASWMALLLWGRFPKRRFGDRYVD